MPGIRLGPKEGPEGTWDICVSPLLYRAVESKDGASKHFVLLCDESANEQARQRDALTAKDQTSGLPNPSMVDQAWENQASKGTITCLQEGSFGSHHTDQVVHS